MKKAISVFVLVVVIGAAYFLFFKKGEKRPEGPKQQPLALEDNTSTFNNSYNILLSAYIGVKDALIASDTTKATAAARVLAVAADSLKVNEIKGDSMLKETARNFASTVSSSALGMAAEPNLNAKRKEFQIIADAMWTLTQTVQYDGQKLYWHYCPMAFDNSGAYWMSNERLVRNPYFGNEMLECGSVQDSLDYSKKK
jgi:hypothetical protein